MLGYVTLGTSQHEASYGFYDQIPGLLGVGGIIEIPNPICLDGAKSDLIYTHSRASSGEI